VSELGDLLELLYGANGRYGSLRSSWRMWHHQSRAQRAFAAAEHSGSMAPEDLLPVLRQLLSGPSPEAHARLAAELAGPRSSTTALAFLFRAAAPPLAPMPTRAKHEGERSRAGDRGPPWAERA